MSNQAIQSCWGSEFPSKCDGVSPAMVRYVAVAIADVVNEDHNYEFWMSAITLAERLELHRETVTITLRHLVKSQVLTVVSKHSPYRPTKYRWTYSKVGSPDTKSRLRLCVNVGSPDTKPIVKPKGIPKPIPGVPPGISTEREIVPTYGADPNQPSRPRPRPMKPSMEVISHMAAIWPAVVTAFPSYHNYKLSDNVAFAKYLNTNFFDSNAKTPMTVIEVKSIVERFMADLRYGSFMLKDSQPVWMAFTARWQNYPVEGPKTAMEETWTKVPKAN